MQNKENRKLTKWYSFIHTNCQMLLNITKIVLDTTRMVIKSSASVELLSFKTRYCKEIVATLKQYSLRLSIEDPDNVIVPNNLPPNNPPVSEPRKPNRNKKQGEIYMYYMSPTDTNSNVNSNKVMQRRTTHKDRSEGYSKRSRYSYTTLQNGKNACKPACIDFTKLRYEETVLNNLEKVLLDCFT